MGEMNPNISPPKTYPWNKGIKIDRDQFPNMGHFGKHTKEARLKITEANIKNAKKRGSQFYKDIQKLSIKVGKERGSYKGTLGKTGEKSYIWKGHEASYNSKHRWIQNHWEKTGICQKCGDIPKPIGRLKVGTKWANLDGKSNREDESTWMELCAKCHYELDHPNGMKRNEKGRFICQIKQEMQI